MIKTESVEFKYSHKSTSFTFPNIHLSDNENLVILGKSGIGKTTLLHLLAGLLKPNSGKIEIDGIDIHKLSNNKLDIFRGQNLGLVFQKKHAVQSLSVFKNLQARLFFSQKPSNNKAIESLLEQLDLKDCKHKKTYELSEGQLQRLSIALSVIHHPKIILADEPTSSLDDGNCNIVINLLKTQAQKNNANLIVITHDQRIKSFFQNVITL